MGNRAIVVFRDADSFSPQVYLHWHGHAVPNLLATWWQHMEGRRGDLAYGAARFVGICHEAIVGNMSLGIFPLPESKVTREELRALSHGDAGVFLVDVRTGFVERICGSEGECDAPRVFQCGETEWTAEQFAAARAQGGAS